MSDEKNRNDEKLPFFTKVKRTVAEYRGEYKKIVWPSRKTLIKQSIAVIVVCGIITGIIWGFDAVFTVGQTVLLRITEVFNG